jgi:hypothetical protein
MIKEFHIEKDWNIEDFYNLDYSLAFHKDKNLIDMYESLGHYRNSMSIYNCHEPNYMPQQVLSYIKSKFVFLENISMAVNLIKPGQYLPLHVDLFVKFIEVHKVDLEKIIRYIVMLEDGYPGQILQIENQCYTEWRSGDCFGWKYNEKHASYNFSLKDRYAIQVTGVLNEI